MGAKFGGPAEIDVLDSGAAVDAHESLRRLIFMGMHTVTTSAGSVPEVSGKRNGDGCVL